MAPTNPEKSRVDLDRVRALVQPILVAHGVSLVDLLWVRDRLGWTLKVTIEREGAWDQSGPFLGAGVTLDDCAEVSRDVSTVLDHDEVISHAYHLEVGSPGLDRPLRAEADFRRFRGVLAKVKLTRAAPDGQKLLRGILDEAPEGRVAVVVDGKRVEVPYGDVAEAHLVYEAFGGNDKGPSGKRAPGAKSKRASGAKGKKT